MVAPASWLERLRPLMHGLLDLVFAPVCLSCGARIAAGDAARLVCRLCRSRLRPPPPPLCTRCGAPRLRTGRQEAGGCGECRSWPASLKAARSACVLADPARGLVHQLKYRGWSNLASPMAERMVATPLPAEADRADLVVPVPTTAERRRRRGYNQAELLAREYARRTGRRTALLLERRSATGTQTTLGPVARSANVAGAFRPVHAGALSPRGRHLLLIDDVLTTGATLGECATTLASAGAAWVGALTFARALDRRVLADPEPTLAVGLDSPLE